MNLHFLSLRLPIVFLLGLATVANAQESRPALHAATSLPDSPGTARAFADPAHGQVQQTSGVVSGTILDISGTPVPGAHISLTFQDGKPERSALADSKGRFSFFEVPPGNVQITVTADGLETFISNQIALIAGEDYEFSKIALPVEGTHTDIQVVATQEEIAQEQVRAQEKQRVLGIFPNFYTSFIWDAAPLRPKHKFSLVLRSTTDPVAFILTGITAGVEQAHNTFPGYGDDTASYFKRYGAAYGDGVTGRILGSAILPSLFHQDPRYFYKGSGTRKSRFYYAITRVVVTRGDNGRPQPNYSRILGSFAAAGLSNLYRDPSDRKPGLTIRNGFIITAAGAVSNLAREFLFRRATTNVPDYEQGEPVK